MKRLNKEYVKFFVVGSSAFIIDFLILNTLVYILDFRTQIFNFVLVANILSTITAVLFGFYFQKHWTFKSQEYEEIRSELLLFTSLQLFNIIVYNSIVFNVFVNIFNIPIPISKILVAGAQMITSYGVMKFLIFAKGSRESTVG